MTNHGGARTLGLAAELRDRRQAANLTLRQVAALVDLSISTLSRVENGTRRISPEDTATLLSVYGVSGPDRKRLLTLAHEQNRSGWWEFEGNDLPKNLSALVEIEQRSDRITHAAMLRVPGLLQTPDYIRTTLNVIGFPRDRQRAMLEARLRRQQVLSGHSGPRYLAIIDEAALRRPTGTNAVMRDQLAHLAEVANLPRVELRVIPFDHGPHVGQDGSFVLLESRRARSLVYLELPQSAMFLDAPNELRVYQETAARLVHKALTSSESVKFIRSLALTYGRE